MELAARRGCENSLGDAYAKSALQNKHSDSQMRKRALQFASVLHDASSGGRSCLFLTALSTHRPN